MVGFRKLRIYTASGFALMATFAGFSMLVGRFDQSGLRFFDTGAAIVSRLDQLASAFSSRDMTKAE